MIFGHYTIFENLIKEVIRLPILISLTSFNRFTKYRLYDISSLFTIQVRSLSSDNQIIHAVVYRRKILHIHDCYTNALR